MRRSAKSTGEHSHASHTLSPSDIKSPKNALSSREQPHDDHIRRQDFDNVGIKLKKKASSNFGAPFGQLGGFTGIRKMS